jgi:hypothetical protein
LNYLSPDQGLADLAVFATKMSQTLSEAHKIPERRWIVVGGSYPGAMSAWFRYKYPHISLGSLASSAVVEAIADYSAYDDHVFDMLSLSGPECPKRIQENTKYIKDMINKGKFKDVLAKFGYTGDKINIGDFYYFLADISAGAVQGSRRKAFCDELTAIKDSKDSYTQFMVDEATKDHLLIEDYDNNKLKDTGIDFNKPMRQWVWQTCTHLGYFQTPGKNKDMRGNITMPFWYQYCENIYGAKLITDDKTWNMRYGGKNLQTSKTIFTNSKEDPWRHASITKTSNPNINVIDIDCEGCSHCADLKAKDPKDPPQLTQARLDIIAIMTGWLAEEKMAEHLTPGLRESFL